MQLQKAEVGPTSGPTWRLSHSGPRRASNIDKQRVLLGFAAEQIASEVKGPSAGVPWEIPWETQPRMRALMADWLAANLELTEAAP